MIIGRDIMAMSNNQKEYVNLPDSIIGVNNNKLEDLTLSLNNDIDSISTILSELQMEFYNIRESFKGDVADSFQEKWEHYNKLIPLIKDNLKTYSDDMLSILSLVKQIDNESARTLETFEEKTEKSISEQQLNVNSERININIAPSIIEEIKKQFK